MGQGAPKDYASAVYWFEKASDGGDPSGKLDLGVMYENGWGVSKDPAKAQQLYREASRLGNEDATKRLEQFSVGH
jgi:TPR repeat protein